MLLVVIPVQSKAPLEKSDSLEKVSLKCNN